MNIPILEQLFLTTSYILWDVGYVLLRFKIILHK